jgi:hypothetical protein
MGFELVIRAGQNDHDVIADLLASGGAAIFLPRQRPLIGRLVVDAHVAVRRPSFATAAANAGVPLLVDPLTPLWQGQVREDDRWARLSFGRAEPLREDDLANPFLREQLVAEVVDFQVEQKATAIIPPYPYVESPTDPWFERALELIRATARYMARSGIHLPLSPILCARLQTFAAEKNWVEGLDRFALTALDVGPQFLGLCLSPITGKDSYSKVLHLFAAARRLRQFGRPVIGWRQGLYGPGLVAAGLDGYETGIGTSELCNVTSSIQNRKPPKPGQKRRGGGGPGIYIEPLARSVSGTAGQILLGELAMRPKVMCDDERCCPHGPQSTIDHRREHAVRTRARVLAALEAQPHTSWRLHEVARSAQGAVTLSSQVNKLLRKAGRKEQIPARGMESLVRVANHLRSVGTEREAA